MLEVFHTFLQTSAAKTSYSTFEQSLPGGPVVYALTPLAVPSKVLLTYI